MSTIDGVIPVPGEVSQQTAALILDIDLDGTNDFVIGSRQGPGSSLVWYRRGIRGWARYQIEKAVLDIEAGGAFYDIDADGDLDIVMGGDSRSNEVWWWENPYPDFEHNDGWNRHLIKDSGDKKHHDQLFGDVDGDGQAELIFWNQANGNANQDKGRLLVADIPLDAKGGPWPATEIYAGFGEGLALADVDGDGQEDIVGGGHWFEHLGNMNFAAHAIDASQNFTRVAVGQLKQGGAPEVVFVPGDGVGPLNWYEWDGSRWNAHRLLEEVDHGHSLAIVDMNQDGNDDIFVAEMRLNGGNEDAQSLLLLGDGKGSFETATISTGVGNHESRVADLDGDGDLDILGKPYNWQTPRLDIWINEGLNGSDIVPMAWTRHVIDTERPWRAIFITSGDVNGDGYADLLTGGWWYENPGRPGGQWGRNSFGEPLNNLAAVYDFDGDGDPDVLGTAGKGAEDNATFVWGRNDGSGTFTLFNNIEPGDGDFLQGVAIERFENGETAIALSWHADGKGVQTLSVPTDPVSTVWTWQRLADQSQDEALSAGDIDDDGRVDLLLGTRWLRNEGNGEWSSFALHETDTSPDRNRLADIDGDGRLDAVVGYEAISQPGKLAWYKQSGAATELWMEHIIASPPIIGPMSLDVTDMDGDGDPDVVVGEHNTEAPDSAQLLIFENLDGLGTEWAKHLVYQGDEHHDGAQVVDIDGDGDQDIISIGWTHNEVLLYENRGFNGETPNNQVAPEAPTETTGTSTAVPQIRSETMCSADNLLALYNFDESEGAVVHDVSGFASPLNLQIEGGGTAWQPNGSLAIEAGTLIRSDIAASKIIAGIQATDEISVEVWIKPANTDQDGPARIVTLSGDANNRNFTLGQGKWGDMPTTVYDMRVRTTATDSNGIPSLTTQAGAATSELSHVVYSQSFNGVRTFYVNGESVVVEQAEGSFADWENDFHLALANEIGGERPWLGELHYLAIYNCALSETDVNKSFIAGENDSGPVGEVNLDRQEPESPTADGLSEEPVPAAAGDASTIAGENEIGAVVDAKPHEQKPESPSSDSHLEEPAPTAQQGASDQYGPKSAVPMDRLLITALAGFIILFLAVIIFRLLKIGGRKM